MTDPDPMPDPRSEKPLVLIVEDEVLVRMLISDILQDGGFRVIEAKNTMEALRVLEARPDVQVIFTDAEMPPGPTGFELARQVCKGWPYIEIIIRQGERGPPLATCPIPAYSFRSLGQQQALPGMFRKPQIERWRADECP